MLEQTILYNLGLPIQYYALVNFDGFRGRLQNVLHVADAHVVAQPDPDSSVPFQVILGADYSPCLRLDWMDTTSAGTANH